MSTNSLFLALLLLVPSSSQQTAPQNSSTQLFPNIDQIGHLGPTSYGVEPSLIYSTIQPSLQNHFPIPEPNLTTQYPGVSKNATPFQISRLWGNLSPMYSLPPDAFGVQRGPQVPDGCSLDQVHLLHRHGARYPASDVHITNFAKAIASAQSNRTFQAKGDLEFLNKWKHGLGTEVLTPFGRSQMFQLGVSYRQKYGFLLNKKSQHALPVFRTTSQDRMYHSAINFAAGFFGLPNDDQYHQSILIEQTGFNNSLAPYHSCPNYLKREESYHQATAWKEIYLKDARQRLNQLVNGFQFSTKDIHTMQNLCAYESVALGTSDFCKLFTEEEWKDFNYANDLDFWYSASFGNQFSAALGAGWTSELLARLSKTPLSQGMTSVNMTLNSNSETFPLNQSIYVDATHDSAMASVIVALNLTSLAQSGPLPYSRRLEPRSFNIVQITPFAAQLTAQVLSCPNATGSTTSSSTQYIRLLLNDAVVPLNGLHPCQSSDPTWLKFGLCSLDKFIAGLHTRLNEIDFQHICFDSSPPTSYIPN